MRMHSHAHEGEVVIDDGDFRLELALVEFVVLEELLGELDSLLVLLRLDEQELRVDYDLDDVADVVDF